jgi:large subunit ribosomal protein L31
LILYAKYNHFGCTTKYPQFNPCQYAQNPYFCSPLKIRHGQNHAKTIKKFKTMKKEIHPNYKEVIFWDTTSDFKFLSRSTNVPKETIKWTDGKDYPVIKVEVSSASHPFFTGKKMFLDTAGRVEKFQKKYGKKETAQ